MNTSKYVTDWFVTKDPSNVYNLVINTTQRYCYHYQMGEDENTILFVVADNEEQDISDETGLILEIPKFLPEIEGTWITSSVTVKDQIHYYFIPYLWEWVKREDKLVMTSDNFKI